MTLDLLLNGALGATEADNRPRSEVCSIVWRELASGSTVTDACASALVSPVEYMIWLDESADLQDGHDKALKTRAALLADRPLDLARELAAARRQSVALGSAKLGEVASAMRVESDLIAKATGTGSGQASGTATAAPVVRIVFEPLPPWAVTPEAIPDASIEYPTDMQSVAGALASGDATSDYDTLAD